MVATSQSRITGKERDTETGLDYFGARYYGSNMGRFTTVDPVLMNTRRLIDPQRWNMYAYTRNNPLSYTDPDGADPVTVTQQTYAVSGSTAAEAWSNARKHNPNSAKGRGEADWGSFRATYKTQWKTVQAGNGVSATVTVTEAHVTTDVTVTTPTWTGRDQASPSEQQQWDTAVNALKDHEQGHVDIVQQNVDKVQEQLNGTTGTGQGGTQDQALNKANQDAKAKVDGQLVDAEQNTQQHSDAYDERTKNGEIPR